MPERAIWFSHSSIKFAKQLVVWLHTDVGLKSTWAPFFLSFSKEIHLSHSRKIKILCPQFLFEIVRERQMEKWKNPVLPASIFSFCFPDHCICFYHPFNKLMAFLKFTLGEPSMSSIPKILSKYTNVCFSHNTEIHFDSLVLRLRKSEKNVW